MSYPTLPLAVYEDYARVKQIVESQETPTDVRHITDMLRRATARTEQFTHRRFHPFYETRRLNIPSRYADLNNRLLYREDLWLDEDLLYPVRVQITSNTVSDTGDSLQLAIDANTSILTLLDASQFAIGDLLLVDQEVMTVVFIDANVHVQRGQLDTIATAHDSGAGIQRYNVQTLRAGTDYVLLDYNVSPKYGIRLAFPNTWAGGFYTSASYKIPTILVTGVWGYHRDYRYAWVNTLDALQANISASATALSVADADGTDINSRTRFEVGRLLRIGDEFMMISAVDADLDTVVVVRGINGTYPTPHSLGARIDVWYPMDDIVDAVLSIAKMLYESSQTTGGRMGVSEMSQGVELTLPQDAQQILKHYRKALL